MLNMRRKLCFLSKQNAWTALREQTAKYIVRTAAIVLQPLQI